MSKKMNKLNIKNYIYIFILCLICISNINIVFASDASTEVEVATVNDASTTTEAFTELESDDTYYYDINQCIVEVRLIYVDNNNEEHILKSGNGFYIGSAESGIYILSGRNSVTLSDTEKANILTQYQIEEKNLKLSIQFKIEPDIYMNTSTVADSNELGIIILAPTETVGQVDTLRLCEDLYGVVVGDEVKFVGKMSGQDSYSVTGQVVDWRTNGAIHYYLHDVIVDGSNYGCPVLNNDNQVIGINIYSESVYNYALQIQDVIKVCQEIGIDYNPEIVVDLEELKTVIDTYEEMDLSVYSEDSVAACENLYIEISVFLELVEDGEVDYFTQDIINEYVVCLNNAIDGLEKKEMSKDSILVLLIVIASVLAVGIIVLLICFLVSRKKYKRMLEDERNNTATAKEALKLSGRIVPGKKENRLSASMPLNRSLTTITNNNQFVSTETSVLGAGDISLGSHYSGKIQNNAYLVRRRTGEEILINKNTFIIGTDNEAVDYYISYNHNISKKHACISLIKGNYYIQDMETTNGTFVNGFRLEGSTDTMLQHGAIIVVADEEFEFRK